MALKPKLVVLCFLILLALVILLQNTQVVSFQILFWSISMSRIIFFMLLIGLGFGLGYVYAKRFDKAK